MDFVYEIPNNLSDEKCEELIKRFEANPSKKPGIVGLQRKINSVKRSLDLPISSQKEFKDIDEYLHTQLGEGIKKYCEHVKCGIVDDMFINSHDSGYQMQKTEIGDFYSWHDDSMMTSGRFMTFLWYLTSHDPITHGGGTAIHKKAGDGGKIIAPERGKLLLFPATWTYIHMGLPLIRGDPKYICTGWIHDDRK